MRDISVRFYLIRNTLSLSLAFLYKEEINFVIGKISFDDLHVQADRPFAGLDIILYRTKIKFSIRSSNAVFVIENKRIARDRIFSATDRGGNDGIISQTFGKRAVIALFKVFGKLYVIFCQIGNIIFPFRKYGFSLCRRYCNVDELFVVIFCFIFDIIRNFMLTRNLGFKCIVSVLPFLQLNAARRSRHTYFDSGSQIAVGIIGCSYGWQCQALSHLNDTLFFFILDGNYRSRSIGRFFSFFHRNNNALFR